MKNKIILLSLSLSILFATALSAQAPPNTFQMNKNAAIQFLNSDGMLDSTEIVRKWGNALYINYNDSPLRIRAFDNKPLQLRDSLNETKIQLSPDGRSYFMGGNVGIGTTYPNQKLVIEDKAPTFRIVATGNNREITIKPNAGNIQMDNGALHLNRYSTHHVGLATGGGNVGIGTANPKQRLEIDSGNMVILGKGRIGLGTGSPAYKLDVVDTFPVFRIRALANDRDIIIKPSDGNIEATNTVLNLNRWSTRDIALVRGGGKVGIGTFAPTAKLHIADGPGAGDASVPGIGGYLVLGDIDSLNIAIDNNEIMARNNNGISVLGLQADGGAVTIHGGALVTEESRKVHINDLGQVGIGTLQPSAPLEIKQTRPLIVLNDTDGTDTLQPRLEIRNNPAMVFNGTDVSNNQVYRFYQVYSPDRNHDAVLEILGKQTGGWNNKLILTHDGSNGIVNTGTGNLILQPSNGTGQVAINTSTFPTDTDYKLAVNGKIISTEVQVQKVANWPDYVFEKDYPLLPLDQLEATIQQNGHLPGIPSAEEVKEKGGVEVGDMQQRLLEKVEELTLYIIQLEKRVKELENRE